MEDCERLLNNPCYNVHIWLDGMTMYFPVGFFGDYHRSFRHNSYGIGYVKEKWGYEAEKAAKIHIVRDFDDKIILDTYKDLNKWYNKAIMWFNNPENMELRLAPSIIAAWNNNSLVKMATEKI